MKHPFKLGPDTMRYFKVEISFKLEQSLSSCKRVEWFVPGQVKQDEDGRDEQKHFGDAVLDANGQDVAVMKLVICERTRATR